ncbi:HPr family phosphocarrier protein [Alkalicoccus urumqiensis]|uniref:Phosphocarrier HPr family protein n=1 Tax=Alkalicoccus urumqiensis TaxID=1548213 RepID=A0A2P6MJ62_ALKUR|nr:HPr family phosphocarrier protein [Alkalicoccus urumqiensis]PRO66300.1 phosphocarrier HPr family protein [Alkalicoccus urumqiensis]
MKRAAQEVTVNIREDQTITELSASLQPYRADVYIEKMSRGSHMKVNVKSFLGLVTIHLENGDTITVSAEGEDADQALEEAVRFFAS